MSKHTPGPWASYQPQSTPATNPCGAAFVVGPRQVPMDRSIGFTVADANLIAAAPDLLEALEGLFKIGDVFGSAIEHKDPHCQSFDDWAEKALEAIARAKGESQ